MAEAPVHGVQITVPSTAVLHVSPACLGVSVGEEGCRGRVPAPVLPWMAVRRPPLTLPHPEETPEVRLQGPPPAA